MEHFFALAKLLGQNPRWLATGKAPSRIREIAAMPPVPNFPAPTGDERALLHYIRHMPDTLRKLVLRLLRELSNIYVSPDKASD